MRIERTKAMFLLALALPTAKLEAQASWVSIARLDEATLSLDTLASRITKSGTQTFQVLFSRVFHQEQHLTSSPTKTYKQQVSVLEVRCRTLSHRDIHSWAYDAAGNTVAEEDTPRAAFREIEPGSLDQRIISSICDFALGRTRPFVPVEVSIASPAEVPNNTPRVEVFRGAPPVTARNDKPEIILESRIDGFFTGWDGETSFHLVNGQVWKQARLAIHVAAQMNPRIRILLIGNTYFLEVERPSRMVAVTRVR